MSRLSRPGPITRIAPIATAPESGGYLPGACNIGPWEIRRRRAFSIVGFAAAAVALAWLLLIGASPVTRVVLLLPLWGGMFSWLQARRRFCAAFAMAGLANFGPGAGTRRAVVDPVAHRADMLAALRLARDSFLLALVVTLVAVLLAV